MDMNKIKKDQLINQEKISNERNDFKNQMNQLE